MSIFISKQCFNFFLFDAIITVTYLINILPNATLNFKSPLKILYQEKIIISHLRVFECTSFVHNNKSNKLDHTSIKAILLGYSSKKSYKCYNPVNTKIYISRDIIFQENESY
jgi:hypothetical protein